MSVSAGATAGLAVLVMATSANGCTTMKPASKTWRLQASATTARSWQPISASTTGAVKVVVYVPAGTSVPEPLLNVPPQLLVHV